MTRFVLMFAVALFLAGLGAALLTAVHHPTVPPTTAKTTSAQ